MTPAVVESARLRMRLSEARDHPALYAMCADPRARADLGPVKDKAASDEALARHELPARAARFPVVERRKDEAIAGFCGLS